MFITLEGVEGGGKSSLMQGLAESLRRQGREVVLTREPGGSDLGLKLRSILLSLETGDLDPRAELFLYLADRAQHVSRVVFPALERGAVVISDRFADSTIVYQGYGRGLDIDALKKLNDLAVGAHWPDLTLLLDLDVETGLARAVNRNKAEGKAESEGRFEAENLAFHQRIRQGYLDWAQKFPDRFVILNGAKPLPEVLQAAVRAVTARQSQSQRNASGGRGE